MARPQEWLAVHGLTADQVDALATRQARPGSAEVLPGSSSPMQQDEPVQPPPAPGAPAAPAAPPVVLPSFKCPITQSIMRDPVALVAMPPGSKSYERAAIQDWLSTHGTDPCTSEPWVGRR